MHPARQLMGGMPLGTKPNTSGRQQFMAVSGLQGEPPRHGVWMSSLMRQGEGATLGAPSSMSVFKGDMGIRPVQSFCRGCGATGYLQVLKGILGQL